MRYEVLIMMAVVGAINVIGRIMAKRAKERLAAEQAGASSSSAQSQPIARRRAVVTTQATPAPVRESMPMQGRASGKSVLRDAASARAILPIGAPPGVAIPSMAAMGQARVARAPAAPVRPVPARWSARRLRDGLVASEILGPPVSLRG